MIDLKKLEHENACVAMYFRAKRTSGEYRIALGARCMATLPEYQSPTGEVFRNSRKAVKLVAIHHHTDREEVTVRCEGSEYVIPSEGLSGVRCFEDEPSIPLAERCKWREALMILQRRRNEVTKPKNIYVLMERMLRQHGYSEV